MRAEWQKIVIAFGLGAAIGAAVVMRLDLIRPSGFQKGPEKFHKRLIEDFNQKLHLTAEQKEKVSAIMEQTKNKMQALKEESKPRFDEIRDQARTEIRKILTPGQQEEFEKMNRRMDERKGKRREKRGPRPPALP